MQPDTSCRTLRQTSPPLHVHTWRTPSDPYIQSFFSYRLNVYCQPRTLPYHPLCRITPMMYPNMASPYQLPCIGYAYLPRYYTADDDSAAEMAPYSPCPPSFMRASVIVFLRVSDNHSIYCVLHVIYEICYIYDEKPDQYPYISLYT